MRCDVEVPAGPFRKRLRERLDRLSKEYEGDYAQQRLGEELGLNPRSIWRIINEGENIEFSTADQIITRLPDGPLAWQDEDLREIYRTVNLSRMDLLSPIDTPATLEKADRRILEAWDSSSSIAEAGRKLGLATATMSRAYDEVQKRNNRPARDVRPRNQKQKEEVLAP